MPTLLLTLGELLHVVIASVVFTRVCFMLQPFHVLLSELSHHPILSSWSDWLHDKFGLLDELQRKTWTHRGCVAAFSKYTHLVFPTPQSKSSLDSGVLKAAFLFERICFSKLRGTERAWRIRLYCLI